MADDHFIQNVPVPYMDLQTLWNDRRDPHANPMSTSPRREEARTGKGDSGLGKAVEGIFHPSPFDERPSTALESRRLYEGEKSGSSASDPSGAVPFT
jgi:hypothetical protein